MRITLSKWIRMFTTSLATLTLKVALSESQLPNPLGPLIFHQPLALPPMNTNIHPRPFWGFHQPPPACVYQSTNLRSRSLNPPAFNLESVPRGTLAATIMEFPVKDSIELFVMTEGYQEQPTTAENVLNVLQGQGIGSNDDEILAEPLGGITAEREFKEIFPRLTGLAPVGPFIPSAVSEGNTADLVLEYVPPCDTGDEDRAGGRYWGDGTFSVPQDGTARNADGSFRWPGIGYKATTPPLS
ncbi:hypothetical protein TWF679_010177 [Orbilia oligospora]|uniref:Uncharacterized protein n=1 Tax=Orbilia oligospora TaxID=2813651 RepID=A0A8H8V109_ORBOL|nr:hypothetical protein TWF679_010177 [Orbilia oligospora]